MNILKKKIHNLINENGPISLAKFMEISLGDEKYGYYRKKMPLGSGGGSRMVVPTLQRRPLGP